MKPGPKTDKKFVFRCPACGDQTLQVDGGNCGPCFIQEGVSVVLVACTREKHERVSVEEGAAFETVSCIGHRHDSMTTRKRVCL